jgi:hypothetical protein
MRRAACKAACAVATAADAARKRAEKARLMKNLELGPDMWLKKTVVEFSESHSTRRAIVVRNRP